MTYLLSEKEFTIILLYLKSGFLGIQIHRKRHKRLYFPAPCPKWIFHIPINLVEKKHTKLIYHMAKLYPYSPFPFHRSYKNWLKILKNYPPWIMEVLKWNVLISIAIVGKNLPKMIGHMPWISQYSPKLY